MAQDKQDVLRRKARNSVFRLLKIRLRSEYELRDKLKNKNIPEEIINETIDYFKSLEFIDDRQFTRAWISSRLKKPYGSNRIRFELKNKGIHPDIIDEEIKQSVSSENYSELDVISQLATRRAEKFENLDPVKKRQRIYGYLSRRGFSTQNIIKALNKL